MKVVADSASKSKAIGTKIVGTVTSVVSYTLASRATPESAVQGFFSTKSLSCPDLKVA